jgi:ABC-type Fe3+/spermidine/putrescine transport system ATPase subunit
MIHATHDRIEAMTMVDRIVTLNGGHIEQVGSPIERNRDSVTLFVAAFRGGFGIGRGDRLSLAPPPDRIHRFGADGAMI